MKDKPKLVSLTQQDTEKLENLTQIAFEIANHIRTKYPNMTFGEAKDVLEICKHGLDMKAEEFLDNERRKPTN